jgi:ABC-type transporter Mla MlaB component
MTAPRRTTIACDARALVDPDVGAVAMLARLQLLAGRRGCELRLRGAPPELRELIDLVGLAEVLRVEPGREPEEREQRLGVEEERELPDPPV